MDGDKLNQMINKSWAGCLVVSVERKGIAFHNIIIYIALMQCVFEKGQSVVRLY